MIAGVASLIFAAASAGEFPLALQSYGDQHLQGLGAKLLHRIAIEPFNAVGSLIFLAAIVHTFLVARFRHVSHCCERELAQLSCDPAQAGEADLARCDRLRFKATLFHFLGEIEVVFGIWLVPLFIAIGLMKSFPTAITYLDGVNYTEAIFVTVIMGMASTRPVIQFAERCLASVARLFGGSTMAWWFAILTVGPLLGSLITEPAAMTVCALLLGQRFYRQEPPVSLRYATLGLLFVNISVGGTLTHFAAPPVVMVAGKWGLGAMEMLTQYGWKAVIGVVLSNVVYGLYYRKTLRSLQPQNQIAAERSIPFAITAIHLLFLGWTVLIAHHPSLVVGSFLFFLAFVATTEGHQDAVSIRGPLLVGFFLAALVAHGGCQQWWIGPVLGGLNPLPLMLGSTALTAFNDNAAITYLASLVPNFSEPMRYAVLAGAVSGGGLTVIANAPNPAGQSLLQRYFGEDGISPLKLFLAALGPTVIVTAAFLLL